MTLQKIKDRTWFLLQKNGVNAIVYKNYVDIYPLTTLISMFPRENKDFFKLTFDMTIPHVTKPMLNHDDLFDFLMDLLETFIPHHKAVCQLYEGIIFHPELLSFFSTMVYKKSVTFLTLNKLISYQPIKDIMFIGEFALLISKIFRFWIKNPEDEKILTEVDQGLKKILKFKENVV
jgi:hypothetical protein